MPEIQSEIGTVAADITRKDTVAIVLGDTLTQGERTFVERGQGDHVLNTRHHLQLLMREDLIQLVEEKCGREVEAFFSDNHIDPDYSVEFFLLEPLPSVESFGGSAPADEDPE